MQTIITYTLSHYLNLNISFRSNKEFRILSLRSTIFTLHSFVLCWSQSYLPLYIVHTISAIGPIFVCLLNFLLRGKKINQNQVIGMFVAFAGILLTVNGRTLWASMNPDFHFISDFKNYKSDDPFVMLVVSGLLLLFVGFWAYGIYITKKNQHHILEVVYHQSIFGIIGSSLAYVFLEQRVSFYIFSHSFLWIGLVLGGGFTIFNVGLSLSENTGVCSMITQVTVIIGYGYSVFRYGEPVNPVCLVGTVLLIGGVSSVIFLKGAGMPHHSG